MWIDTRKINPLAILLDEENPALQYFVKRDLLDENTESVENLWELPEPAHLISKQNPDGSWRYKGKRPGDALGENYELLETWRNLRVLVDMFGLNRTHPAIEQAAEYIFSCQTDEGDIRGILSNQYMPYYMGAMIELLVKTGFENDDRVLKGLNWLLDMRQDDGGWIIPMMMFKMKEFYSMCNQPPIQPIKEKPFSHMATGMVIRAFATHPDFRKSESVIHAGELLKKRLFQKDAYTSRKSVDFWFKFQFPFWWTDLLTVLDSLMRMDFPSDDPDIMRGLDWFIEHQKPSGGWNATYRKTENTRSDLWVTYAVCRVLKFFLN